MLFFSFNIFYRMWKCKFLFWIKTMFMNIRWLCWQTLGIRQCYVHGCANPHKARVNVTHSWHWHPIPDNIWHPKAKKKISTVFCCKRMTDKSSVFTIFQEIWGTIRKWIVFMCYMFNLHEKNRSSANPYNDQDCATFIALRWFCFRCLLSVTMW